MKTKFLIQLTTVLLFLALLPKNSKALTITGREDLQQQSYPVSIRKDSKSLFKTIFGKPSRMYCYEKTKIRHKGIHRVRGCYKFK